MDVQEEIARDISEKLRVRISGDQQKKMAMKPTRNPEAYQLYLLGRYQYNRYSDTAIEHFRQAVAKDPNFAEAYTGLADTYVMFADYQFPATEAGPLAKDAARRALAINDGLAEAHNALATIYSLYDWNWTGAENEFRRALHRIRITPLPTTSTAGCSPLSAGTPKLRSTSTARRSWNQRRPLL